MTDKMDAKTLKALEGSIAKWAKLSQGRGFDAGGENCPLCQMFARTDHRNPCGGCPVKARTGRPECYDTPYYRWLNHAENKLPDYIMLREMRVPKSGRRRERALKAARAMRDFLRSLLPKDAA